MDRNKRSREEACLICGHYHDIDNGQPCSICGHVMATHERKQLETVVPTCIISGSLYLSNYDTASRAELLKAMGITHILNTVPSCPALFKNTFKYHTLPTSPPDFEECYNFIDNAIKDPESKVLVYCMSGTSRSPSVVIAYLMKARGWRLAECYKWVKDKRPSVHIKTEDSQRLVDLESQIHGACSVPAGLAALDACCAGGFFAMPSTAAAAAAAPAAAPLAASTSEQPAVPIFGGVSGSQPSWSMSAPQQSGATPAFGGASMSTFTFGSMASSKQECSPADADMT